MFGSWLDEVAFYFARCILASEMSVGGDAADPRGHGDAGAVDGPRREDERAVFPAPQVNMNYDYDAAADARVRALHQRLDRLEEWKRSGLIDSAEYEELRKKYLNIKTDHGTAGTERGTNGK